jgi:OOP family OmpA-OmpF porin
LFFATAFTAQSATAQATGFFVEGTAGYGKFDLGNTSGWTVDDKDSNWGLTGGYMFTPYFGVEGGYRDLGSASGSTGTYSGTIYGRLATVTGTINASSDADGWLLGIRGNLPINNRFAIYGRVGWYRWDADLRASVAGTLTWGGTVYTVGTTASSSESGTDPYYGLGMVYSLTPQVGIGIGYTHFRLKDIDVKNDSFDVNLGYKF